MRLQHSPDAPIAQRANLPSQLPEAKILSGLPLTAAQLSRVLGGKPAGAEWHYEGYVIGNEAWIDAERDYDVGVYIRCRDIKDLLRRAETRLGTPDGIVRRYAPALRLYVNAPVTTGKRSDVLFKIIMTLAEKGALIEEIIKVAEACRCAQSKYGGRGRALKREVERILSKCWRSHVRH